MRTSVGQGGAPSAWLSDSPVTRPWVRVGLFVLFVLCGAATMESLGSEPCTPETCGPDLVGEVYGSVVVAFLVFLVWHPGWAVALGVLVGLPGSVAGGPWWAVIPWVGFSLLCGALWSAHHRRLAAQHRTLRELASAEPAPLWLAEAPAPRLWRVQRWFTRASLGIPLIVPLLAGSLDWHERTSHATHLERSVVRTGEVTSVDSDDQRVTLTVVHEQGEKPRTHTLYPLDVPEPGDTLPVRVDPQDPRWIELLNEPWDGPWRMVAMSGVIVALPAGRALVIGHRRQRALRAPVLETVPVEYRWGPYGDTLFIGIAGSEPWAVAQTDGLLRDPERAPDALSGEAGTLAEAPALPDAPGQRGALVPARPGDPTLLLTDGGVWGLRRLRPVATGSPLVLEPGDEEGAFRNAVPVGPGGEAPGTLPRSWPGSPWGAVARLTALTMVWAGYLLEFLPSGEWNYGVAVLFLTLPLGGALRALVTRPVRVERTALQVLDGEGDLQRVPWHLVGSVSVSGSLVFVESLWVGTEEEDGAEVVALLTAARLSSRAAAREAASVIAAMRRPLDTGPLPGTDDERRDVTWIAPPPLVRMLQVAHAVVVLAVMYWGWRG